MVGPTSRGRAAIHRPTAYDRFDNNKRNSWLDDIQARIQKGINPPVDAGPSRTPSPFEDEDGGVQGGEDNEGMNEEDLEYADVFGAPGAVEAMPGAVQAVMDQEMDGVQGAFDADDPMQAVDRGFEEAAYLQDMAPQTAGLSAQLVQDSWATTAPFADPTNFVQDTAAFDPALFDQYLSAPTIPQDAGPSAYSDSDQAMAADFFQSLSQAAVASQGQAPPDPTAQLYPPLPGIISDTMLHADDSLGAFGVGDDFTQPIEAGLAGDYQFALTGSTDPYVLPEDEAWGGVVQHGVSGEAAMEETLVESMDMPWVDSVPSVPEPAREAAVPDRERSVELADEYDANPISGETALEEEADEDEDIYSGESGEDEGEWPDDGMYSREGREDSHAGRDGDMYSRDGSDDEAEEEAASSQSRPQQSHHRRFDDDSEDGDDRDEESDYDAARDDDGRGRGARQFLDQEAEVDEEQDELDGSEDEESGDDDEEDEDDEESYVAASKRKFGQDESQPIEISDDEDDDASSASAGPSSRPTNRPRRSETLEMGEEERHDVGEGENSEEYTSDEEDEDREIADRPTDLDDVPRGVGSEAASSRESSRDDAAEGAASVSADLGPSRLSDMDDEALETDSPAQEVPEFNIQQSGQHDTSLAAPSSPQSSMGHRSSSPTRRSSTPPADPTSISMDARDQPASSPAQREPIIIDVTDSDDDSDDGSADEARNEQSEASDTSDRSEEDGVDEREEGDEDEDELPMPPARQTPRSDAMLDLTGSEDSDEEEERATYTPGKSLYVPFEPASDDPEVRRDGTGSSDADKVDEAYEVDGDDESGSEDAGSDGGDNNAPGPVTSALEDEQEDGEDEDGSADDENDQPTSSSTDASQPGQTGDAMLALPVLVGKEIETSEHIRSPHPTAPDLSHAAEEVGNARASPTVYDVPESDEEDVDMDVGASPTSAQEEDSGIEVAPLDDITASAINIAASLLPDVIETPGIEQPSVLRYDLDLEVHTELIPESSAAPSPSGENTPLFDAPAESPATLEETPAVRMIEIPEPAEPVEAATEMIGQPDAVIEHHAMQADDALHVPASAAYEPLISIPSAEEEEQQVEAASGMEVEEPITDAEVAHTDMVNQPDVEIIHHAPHSDDILHAPATAAHNMLSMPTDAEEEEQLIANAGEDAHHAAAAALTDDMLAAETAPTPAEECDPVTVAADDHTPYEAAIETGGMEIDAGPDEIVDLPDPMAAPPATDLEVPLEAGDMAPLSRSPSMDVAPPAEPPTITISSRPPSREDSPVILPDPQAPPPDTHILSPLRAGDMPLQEGQSHSIDVQAPEAEAPLTTPIEGAFKGSPSPELPDPNEPAADAWLPMPDVPVANQPSSPSVVVQVPDEADADVPESAPVQGTAVEEGLGGSDEEAGVMDLTGETGPSAPIARDFAHGLDVPEIVHIPDTPASERDIDLALATTRETTPYAPLRHQHGGLAPSPRRARRSVTPAGDAPTTRSHCDYHKIRLTSETQVGTFLAPQCVLGDAERVTAEGVQDLGKASQEEEKAGKKNAVHHGHEDVGAELAAKLHRVAGAGIFDEGHLYLLQIERVAADENDLEEEAAHVEDGQAQLDPEDDIEVEVAAAPADTSRSHSASLAPEEAGDAQVETGDIEETPAGDTRSKTTSVEPGLGMSTSEDAGIEEEQGVESDADGEHSEHVNDTSGDIGEVPAANTRSKTASVEPGLGESTAPTRESTASVETAHGNEHDEPPVLRRSSRLSASVEPAEETAPATRHRRTRSTARAEEAIASSSTAMARTASATSQAAIPEESGAAQSSGKATVRARRSARLKKAADHEEEEEAQSVIDNEATAPRTPARAKPQSKGPASGRKVSTRTRQDEAPYRPVTPDADPEVDSEADSDTPARSRKAGSVAPSPLKSGRKRTPVVEIPTHSPATSVAQSAADGEAGAEASDAKGSPAATRTRKRKYRLSTAADDEAEESGEDESATPSKVKRRAVSKSLEAKTDTEKRVTRSEAKEEQPAKRGFFGSLGKLFGGRK